MKRVKEEYRWRRAVYSGTAPSCQWRLRCRGQRLRQSLIPLDHPTVSLLDGLITVILKWQNLKWAVKQRATAWKPMCVHVNACVCECVCNLVHVNYSALRIVYSQVD